MSETSETTVLYRPVGEAEPRLIERSGFTAFPPRLEHQPEGMDRVLPVSIVPPVETGGYDGTKSAFADSGEKDRRGRASIGAARTYAAPVVFT